jgi:hypothetical protein
MLVQEYARLLKNSNLDGWLLGLIVYQNNQVSALNSILFLSFKNRVILCQLVGFYVFQRVACLMLVKCKYSRYTSIL